MEKLCAGCGYSVVVLLPYNIVNLTNYLEATALIIATQFGYDLLLWIILRLCLDIERLMVYFVVIFNLFSNE